MLIRKKFSIAGPISYTHEIPVPGSPHRFSAGPDTSAPITLTVQGIPFKAQFQGARALYVEGDYPDDAAFLQYLNESNPEENPAYEALIHLPNETAIKILEIVKYLLDVPAMRSYLIHQHIVTEVFINGQWEACYFREQFQFIEGKVLDSHAINKIQSLLDDDLPSLSHLKFVGKAKEAAQPGEKLLLLELATRQPTQATSAAADEKIKQVEATLLQAIYSSLKSQHSL